MLQVVKNLVTYRELLAVLAWKNIAVRYKQSYMGILWSILKPLMLVLIFSMVKSFVGIDSGDIPYPILVFAALLPWVFFQESTSEAINSVVANANLIKKIYFPREIFPITAVLTKVLELLISFIILAGMMIYYEVAPNIHMVWVPIILLYTILISLTIAFAGAAANVYYRDVRTVLPVVLSLVMYASPIIYPLMLVERKLVEEQAAGDWSNFLYTLYTMNPLVGVIDSFQNVMLRGQAPDFGVLWPGLLTVAILLPLSYRFFKKAEAYFADVI